jgi:hypothetical protein
MFQLAWSLFAVCAVGGFITIAAYWLDVQDRPDISFRSRVAWSVGTLVFPFSIPAYALFGGPGWPRTLRVAAFLPALALALFVSLLLGAFR